jgi:hypothetical protein
LNLGLQGRVTIVAPANKELGRVAAEHRFGRLGICVTCSGGPPSKLSVDTNPEDWRAAADLLFMSFL